MEEVHNFNSLRFLLCKWVMVMEQKLIREIGIGGIRELSTRGNIVEKGLLGNTSYSVHSITITDIENNNLN